MKTITFVKDLGVMKFNYFSYRALTSRFPRGDW